MSVHIVGMWRPEGSLSYQSLDTIHLFIFPLFLFETGSLTKPGTHQVDRTKLAIELKGSTSLIPHYWDYKHALLHLTY